MAAAFFIFIFILFHSEPLSFAGAEVTDSKAGIRQEQGELGARWELLLPAQTGCSWAHPAPRKQGQNNPPGSDVEREKGMSGEPRAVRGVASLLPSFPRGPAPHSRGKRSPGGSRNSPARVSSRQFREALPCGTLQGILAAIPSMAKELLQ